MKNAMVVFGILLGLCAASRAAEYSGNPDRVPSIGFNYEGSSETGDATAIAAPFSTKQDIESTTGILVLDVRVPLSNKFTFNASVGAGSSNTEAKETALLAGQKIETSGVGFSVGFRYYMQ